MKIAVPNKKTMLLVGSTVVLCPDAEGQAKDRESKYNLGLNIGRIEAINHDLRTVDLWWYWGSAWDDANWILWRDPKTKNPYIDSVCIDDLVCDEFDHIVRINMESIQGRRFKQNKFKLSKQSVKDIKRCLETNKDALTCVGASSDDDSE